MVEDKRFATNQNRRFKKAPKDITKRKLDQRFKEVFEDARFAQHISLDPFGNKTIRNDDEIQKLYSLEEKGTSKEKEKENHKTTKTKKYDMIGLENDEDENHSASTIQSSSDEKNHFDIDDKDDVDDVDDFDIDDNFEQISSSSSSSSSSDVSDEEEEDTMSSVWAAETGESVPRGDATARLAIMGCDWDNTTAQDLLMLSQSAVVAAGGIQGLSAKSKASEMKVSERKISQKVLSAKIYPSEMGKKAIEYEKLHGPDLQTQEALKLAAAFAAEKEDAFKKRKAAGEENVEEDDDAFLSRKYGDGDTATKKDIEKIRKYRKAKTMHYYGVVEFDSKETASQAYEELDGIETAFTVDGLDCRFVPDDIKEFPFEPTSTAESIPEVYEAPEGLISSLRHSKAKLAWDETPLRRQRILSRRFNADEMAEMDLRDYLDSEDNDESSDEEKNTSSSKEDKIQRLRKLLLDGIDLDQNEETSNEKSMITSVRFGVDGLEELRHQEPNEESDKKKRRDYSTVKDESDFFVDEQTTNMKSSGRMETSSSKTPVAVDDRNNKERKRERKRKLKAEADRAEVEKHKGDKTLLKSIQKDERFAAVLGEDRSSEFDIDPTSSKYKQTEIGRSLIGSTHLKKKVKI